MGGINSKNININDIVEFRKLVDEFDHLRDNGSSIDDIHNILMSKNDNRSSIDDIHSIIMSKNDGNDKLWTRSNGRLERKDIHSIPVKVTKKQQAGNVQKSTIAKKQQAGNAHKATIAKKQQACDVQKSTIAKKQQADNVQESTITKKQQSSNQSVKEHVQVKTELIQPIYSYLTVVERVNVSRTSKFYHETLKGSEYWQDVVINFNDYDKKFGYPLNAWALLMQRKASFKSIVITIGAGESEIIESLVSNCHVNLIELFKIYVIEDLYYLTCYHHSSIVDLLSDENPRPMSVESKLKSFYSLYDRGLNRGSVIPLLAKSDNLRDVRLVIGQPGEAEMIRKLKNLVSLTVSVIATAQRNDEALLYLVVVLLESIEMLPQLTLLELKDNISLPSKSVQIMSKKLSIKSKTIKTLRVRFGKLTRIYDIHCPSLETVDINPDKFFGNIFLYEDFQDELVHHESLNEEQQNSTSYSLIKGMEGRIVIENPGTYNNGKYVGVYYDRLNRISYFNYIHLPKNCIFLDSNNPFYDPKFRD